MIAVHHLLAATILVPSFALAETATDWIKRSEENTQGKSLQAQVQMDIDRGGGSARTLKFKLWTEGRDKAVVKIIEPTKDRDSGNLRLQINLWQYLANVDRVIKVPPSLMLQSWMGSDFTNDDLVKSSSLTRDYTHKLLGHQKQGADDLVKIECSPKPDAPIVWGKIVETIRTKDAAPIRREFYSEKGELLKTMEGSLIKNFGQHSIPTRVTMKTLKKPGQSTTMTYQDVKYDSSISGAVFQQDFLRKPLK
ncbi:MAG: outer membrane lipoprotein-sorting protein [Proteobacteria bacterium]|nr:MAG: outer membrane lipoprotein-sorting protein [Pseudomonadota bacterium]